MVNTDAKKQRKNALKRNRKLRLPKKRSFKSKRRLNNRRMERQKTLLLRKMPMEKLRNIWGRLKRSLRLRVVGRESDVVKCPKSLRSRKKMT